mgnify:FL=1
METYSTIPEIRSYVTECKRNSQRVALVPTMGALHEGHLSLFRLAAENADKVIASIYVNPTQFAPGEDFEEYPRELEKDLQKCRQEGVSAVFIPSDQTMYPGTGTDTESKSGEQQAISFRIADLNDHLCGAKRSGHFEGVLLVVSKLFNIVNPDVAVFGQKDIQQFIILEHLVQRLHFPIELIRSPIVRDKDGLALSSRNAYLNDEQRALAPSLFRCLSYIKQQISDGAANIAMLTGHQKAELEQKGLNVEYLSVVEYHSLRPVETINRSESGEYVIAGAVYVGETRLIDNIIVKI